MKFERGVPDLRTYLPQPIGPFFHCDLAQQRLPPSSPKECRRNEVASRRSDLSEARLLRCVRPLLAPRPSLKSKKPRRVWFARASLFADPDSKVGRTGIMAANYLFANQDSRKIKSRNDTAFRESHELGERVGAETLTKDCLKCRCFRAATLHQFIVNLKGDIFIKIFLS
jgi:hypothetical protein